MTAAANTLDDTITIDLSTARRNAELVQVLLKQLRVAYNLAPYEYTRAVRIAPGEFPYSHPVLTLNTMIQRDDELLAVYLHEQMHWYATWYSHTNPASWQTIWSALTARYPDVPTGFPVGAATAHSSYLHLIINWLEIEATAELLGRAKAIELARERRTYSGLYKIVLSDYDVLNELYRAHTLWPARPATSMAAADLALAARMDEAPVSS
jgi:hypothetical protein